MATIQKSVESVGMKITVNHGEVDGKIVKTSKTYGDIKEGVTDEAFLATAAAITSMQAVSYTHLDVYKRQALYDKLGMKTDGLFRDNCYYGGKWWDAYLMSILQEEFNK